MTESEERYELKSDSKKEKEWNIFSEPVYEKWEMKFRGFRPSLRILAAKTTSPK